MSLEVGEFGVDVVRQVFVEILNDVVVQYAIGEHVVRCIDDCFEVDCADFRGYIVYISLQRVRLV